MKVCSKCHIVKAGSEFYRNKNSMDGFTSRCKKCYALRNDKCTPQVGKVCTKCGIDKDKNEFHKAPLGKDGLKSICKKCCAERFKNTYQRKESKVYTHDGRKICSKCKVPKLLCEFYIHGYKKGKAKHGGMCIKCLNVHRKEKLNASPETKARKYRYVNQYHKNHREEVNKNSKRFYYKHLDSNREKSASLALRHRLEMRASYLKRLLKQKNGYTTEQIQSHPELLDIKKLQITVHRSKKLIKTKKS